MLVTTPTDIPMLTLAALDVLRVPLIRATIRVTPTRDISRWFRPRMGSRGVKTGLALGSGVATGWGYTVVGLLLG